MSAASAGQASLSPQEAAGALAWRLGLTPAQTGILAQLLTPAGYEVAAGGTPGKSHKVQICKMRATLAAAGFGGVILTSAAAGYIDRSRGAAAKALRYETSLDGRAALFRLAETLPAAADRIHAPRPAGPDADREHGCAARRAPFAYKKRGAEPMSLHDQIATIVRLEIDRQIASELDSPFSRASELDQDALVGAIVAALPPIKKEGPSR